jgi:non-ribosomal peptide synthetase component E (peptide arylation enzyme)
MHLADLMTTAADHHGGRIAIRQDGVSLSYDALERATGRMAALLREHDVALLAEVRAGGHDGPESR